MVWKKLKDRTIEDNNITEQQKGLISKVITYDVIL